MKGVHPTVTFIELVMPKLRALQLDYNEDIARSARNENEIARDKRSKDTRQQKRGHYGEGTGTAGNPLTM